jgi:hypothetical protein
VRSDALCARSKALDCKVQHVQLSRRENARERRAGPLFGARHELRGSHSIIVRAGNSNFIGWELVLTRHGSNGSVYFTVQGLNVKGSNGFTLTTPAAVHQRRSPDRRWMTGSPHHMHRRGNFLENALQGQHSHTPSSHGGLLTWFFSSGLLAALQNTTTFNKTISQNLQPVNFSGAANLFNASFNCPASSAISASSTASLSLDVDADVHATISLGAVAAGTLVPPNITEFGLTLGARATYSVCRS